MTFLANVCTEQRGTVMKHRVKFPSLSHSASTLNPDQQHPLLSLELLAVPES